MKRPGVTIWWAIGTIWWSVLGARAADFYVSPQGADSDRGTRESPFATLQRAQQAARQARGQGPVHVYLRGGVYYLSDTLVFTPEDSGTADAPVSYEAYPNESAVISGGVRLDRLIWEPERAGILKTRVPDGFASDQLFVNGERQSMARYPNFDASVRHFNGYAADALSPERTARWHDPRGGFIHAMHSAEWGGMHYSITGKSAENVLQFEGGWQNNRPSKMHNQFRMVENVFEELDAPGEWFLDRNSLTLYFYPPSGLDLAAATIEAVRLRHLVEFRGTSQTPVRYVTLRGLTFRHAARTFMENKEPLVRSDWTTYRGGAVSGVGTEDCALEDAFIDQVGGNAVFLSGYHRRFTVRGCHIAKAGANGVAFVGERSAARVPRDWNDRSQHYSTLDRTPGPKSEDYPAECLVEDCLIYLSGRVEKQTAPVQIELARDITVRHCSLYDVPRAGINIGDGCWGGHLIEFCDIFDTVKETGDHGSFNSWGRDRFWQLPGLDLNDDATWERERDLPRLDAQKTVILRNNRWRCDHGWDIDLDDGSSNYRLYNNLCLNGGIKNREGFYRIVENNIMVNNGFHPHVWYKHSEDVVRRNLMWTDHYLPAGGMPSTPWGSEMDFNLVHRPGQAEPQPATQLAAQSQRDAHSVVADAQFVDAEHGDFRVRDGSPALRLGFVNFPMDQFGVRTPRLKAIALTPKLPQVAVAPPREATSTTQELWQARVRDISGLGDRSAYGLPGEYGVLLLEVPAQSLAARAGLLKDDVILAADGRLVRTIAELRALRDAQPDRSLELEVSRKQGAVKLTLPPLRPPPAASTPPVKVAWEPVGLSGGGGMFTPAISPANPDLMLLNCDMSAAYVSRDGGRRWRMIHHAEMRSDIRCRPAFHPTEPQTVFASSGGRLKVSRDGGEHFEFLGDLKDALAGLIAVDPADPRRLLVGTVRGKCWRSNDGGVRWTECAGPTGNVLGFHFDRARSWWFAATSQGLWRSQDGGATWRDLTATLPAPELDAFAGGSSSEAGSMLYCSIRSRVENGEFQGGIYRSRDGGETWQWAMGKGINTETRKADNWAFGPVAQYPHLLTTDARPLTVYALNTSTGFSPPHHDTVFRSDDGGDTWRAVYFQDPRFEQYNVESDYVCASAGKSFKGGEAPFGVAICNTDPERVLLVRNECHVTHDGGRRWLSGHTLPAPGQPPKPGSAWACNGLVVTTTWNYYVDPHQPTRHYIAYTDIGFARSLDAGRTWIWWDPKSWAPWRNTCYELAFDPETPGKIWGAFSDVHDIPNDNIISERHSHNRPGGVCVSRDFGASWKAETNGLPAMAVTGIVVDPSSPPEARTLYAGLFTEGVFKSVDDGKTWVRKTNGLGHPDNLRVSRILRHPDGTLFAMICARREGQGKPLLPEGVGLYRSRDAADTWEMVNASAPWLYPKDFSVDPRDSRRILVGVCDSGGGDRSGGLHATVDGGATWRRLGRQGPQTFGGYFHPRHPDWIYMTLTEGAPGAGLWLSRDFGRTWIPFTGLPFANIQRVVLDPADENRLYATTFGGSVWHGPATPEAE